MHRMIPCCIWTAVLCATFAAGAAARPEAPTEQDIEARAATAQKLRKTLSIELTDSRLEDVVTFISDFSGAVIEPMWIDEGGDIGLKKDQRISIVVKDVAVITLLERVLAKAETDFSPATWQFAPSGGAIEIGPRGRLNKQAYLKIYDIQDMLFQIPDFADAPQLDLDQVLNQGGQGGGGGGGSIFGGDTAQNVPFVPTEELAQKIVDIITEYVEPDQWIDNGGDGASIRSYSGHLLIRAPDYIHRQLQGYPFDLGAPKRAAVRK
ncbi:MAG: hypothetical protein JNK58_03340 [Phycisphaerae bacterium]|nr:hypothetical protein [Phycisphaerae bacterium]